jgi:hypothetical protein
VAIDRDETILAEQGEYREAQASIHRLSRVQAS